MYGVTAAAYQRAIARRRLSRQEGQEEPEGMEPSQVAGASNRLRIGVIVGVLVIILAVSAVVLSSHPTPTGVTISFKSAKVLSADSSDVDLAIAITVHNTTPNTVTYWGSAYALTDNGAGVDNGLWQDNVKLSPGATQTLNDTADISLGDVITTAPITAVGTWELQGTATELVAGANVTQNYDFNFATQ